MMVVVVVMIMIMNGNDATKVQKRIPRDEIPIIHGISSNMLKDSALSYKLIGYS